MTESRGPTTGQVGASPPAPVLILGVGNILLRDEGVGVHVIKEMQRLDFPDSVELLDGGTAALDLLSQLAARDKIIVIDAVKGGGEPGAIYRFSPDDVQMQAQTQTSLHQISLVDTLTMAGHLGCSPREVVILGVEPKEIGWGLELSSVVAGVVPKVVELAMKELRPDLAKPKPNLSFYKRETEKDPITSPFRKGRLRGIS